VKVSVVVCTYTLDMYEHFREAADSVLAQTHDDVELVVIVDGTPEVYEQVVDDYGDREDVVIKCNDENVGLLESRNRGAAIASGDVVAFIDDDAIADEAWVGRAAGPRLHEEEDAIAAGGKMTPAWVAGKPSFLPRSSLLADRRDASRIRRRAGRGTEHVRIEYLVPGRRVRRVGRVRRRHRRAEGRQESAGWRDGAVRADAGGVRTGVWYDPDAEVAHKVFEYRTEFRWLVDRAFWQGYSKRAMESFVEDEGGEEGVFLKYIITNTTPRRVKHLVSREPLTEIQRFVMVYLLTGLVGFGYLYGTLTYSA